MNIALILTDMVGFKEKTCEMNNSEVVKLLSEYYSLVNKTSSKCKLKVVKTIGDAVLMRANCSLDKSLEQIINEFHGEITKHFSVITHYRECSVSVITIEFDQYRCDDVIGQDVEKLFQIDKMTKRIG